jgi:hypothetical protein
VLKGLHSGTVTSRPYHKNSETGQIEMAPEGEGNEERSWEALKIQDGMVYVHRSCFHPDKSQDQILRDAIESTFFKHTLPRKLIYGETYKADLPNLFQVLYTKNVPTRRFAVANPLLMSKQSAAILGEGIATRQQAGFVIEMPIDEFVIADKLATLRITPDEDTVAAHTPLTVMMDVLAAIPPERRRRTLDYPKGYESEYRSKRAAWKKALDALERQGVAGDLGGVVMDASSMLTKGFSREALVAGAKTQRAEQYRRLKAKILQTGIHDRRTVYMGDPPAQHGSTAAREKRPMSALADSAKRQKIKISEV